MTGTEPLATALLLTTFGVLLALSIIFSRAAERFAVPVALAFLLIGVLAGSEGIGGIAFENYAVAFRLGTVALVLILFDGGLHTPMDAVRETAKPAGVLATVGVLGTTALIALGGPRARLLVDGGARSWRGRVVHRRRRGVLRSAWKRPSPQAARRRHARGRIRHQRSRRRDADDRVDRATRERRSRIVLESAARVRRRDGRRRRAWRGVRIRRSCVVAARQVAGRRTLSGAHARRSHSSRSACRRSCTAAASSRCTSRG